MPPATYHPLQLQTMPIDRLHQLKQHLFNCAKNMWLCSRWSTASWQIKWWSMLLLFSVLVPGNGAKKRYKQNLKETLTQRLDTTCTNPFSHNSMYLVLPVTHSLYPLLASNYQHPMMPSHTLPQANLRTYCNTPTHTSPHSTDHKPCIYHMHTS